VECLHAFSLIHDDLPCLDNDDFRRGLPTAHKVYGEALALLAGDLLQSLSLEAVGRFSKFATQEKCPVVAEGLLSFSQLLGTKGLIIGQARELESTHLQPHTDLLLQIFREKTGALFALSLSLPWTLYFPESQEAELLRTLGFHLGELYQIADDLEDQGHSSRSTPWHLLELLPIREERDAWVESIKKPLLLLEALNQFPELQAPLDKILRKLHLHETR
jgi:geranylgeranyl diphosphate synthase type II